MSLYEEKPRSKCVIYSFGVDYETRFEGEMLDRAECEIWAYDASVKVKRMGPETHGRPGAYFKPYFIGDKNYVDKRGVQWRTLRFLMKENGHDWIDILKQVELHVDKKHVQFKDFLAWWQKLESKGLRPFWTEINLHPAINFATPWASEYCFINTRGSSSKNILLRDYEV